MTLNLSGFTGERHLDLVMRVYSKRLVEDGLIGCFIGGFDLSIRRLKKYILVM